LKSQPEIQNTIQIANRNIGEGYPCFIIAEIGVNFNGDLELAKKTIDAAAVCGADAVKFQTFHADEFVANRDLKYTYKLFDGTEITESQYDMFKRLELPNSWHKILQDHAKNKGVFFLSSVADKDAVDLLDSLNVPAFKLASEDLINIDLLEYVATKKRPVILSTGMADVSEIERALEIFISADQKDIIILHCVSAYPTPLDSCNLRRISSMSNYFPFPIGFSDHTEGFEAGMLSIGIGSCMLEKHFTLDKRLNGPDHKMSSDPIQFKKLVKMIRKSEAMLGSKELTFAPIEEKGRNEFRRSIVAKRDIDKGEIITKDLLAYKRPGGGLKPYQRTLILGKYCSRKILENEQILLSELKLKTNQNDGE
tara:strand:- start:4291 stop:5391 length:1101 start_codon:yes stop_codon:yes gene_type:complete